MTQENPNIDLVRFTTAGSVDDGKSTLIGRLLYDTKSLFDDQYNDITMASQKRGDDYLNLALLTDGLKDEREQGITIDVAYRYFSTPKRKFIIADTPGHIQYTRNMVTGASTANVVLILIDARKGITEQTRRHALLASLLQIPHLLVCINKMDLVDYDELVYDKICTEFRSFSTRLEIDDIDFIPISALKGDNVVTRTEHMDWYKGGTLIYYFDNIHVSNHENFIDCRFPVQNVIRPHSDTHHDYRGYAGRVASGIFQKGDEVQILPSGFNSTISKIDSYDGELEMAVASKSVTILLEDDIDVSRGDMIVRKNNVPIVTQDLDLMICWFSQKPLQVGTKYIIKHTSNEVVCIITEVLYKLDVNTMHKSKEGLEIEMNDIARIKVRTTKPLFIDSYKANRNTGSLIIINAQTFETIAAGMIR